MADKKISQLTALSAANVASATDVLAIVDTSATETKKITAKDLIDGALNGGTANGVLYLNGSKVATSGSALTFDGSNLGVAAATHITGGSGAGSSNGIHLWFDTATNTGKISSFHAGVDNRALFIDGLNLQFAASGSEQMRLTSTGLGIGTSSPGNKLTINSSGAAGIVVRSADSNFSAINIGVDPSNYTYIDSAKNGTGTARPLAFFIDGSERMRLDTSGNLGLGVTPSAWGNYKAFQISASGHSLAATGAGSGDLTLAFNAFYDSTDSRWEYVYTGDKAGRYSQTGAGNHVWYTTNTSGTAGNEITDFATAKMTLTALGQLELTAAAPRLAIAPSTGTNSAFTHFVNSASANFSYVGIDSSVGGLGTGGYSMALWHGANYPLVFGTNNTERGRFTAGGNFLVGTQTDTIYATAFRNRIVTDSAAAQSLVATDSVQWIHSTNTSGDNLFTTFVTEAVGTNTIRGSIDFNRAGGLTRYNTTSDYRAKDVYGLLDDSGEVIDALKVYRGKMHGATMERPMLIAHEAQKHAPYSVTGEKDAVNDDGNPVYQQMDTSSLVPLLIAEIQSLRSRVAALESA
jgi:hypothetical protein